MAAVWPKPASCHWEPATAHAPPESSGSSSCPPRASGRKQTFPQATGWSSSPVVWADQFETESAALLRPVLKTPAPQPVGCPVMPPCREEQGTREEEQRQVKRQSPRPSLSIRILLAPTFPLRPADICPALALDPIAALPSRTAWPWWPPADSPAPNARFTPGPGSGGAAPRTNAAAPRGRPLTGFASKPKFLEHFFVLCNHVGFIVGVLKFCFPLPLASLLCVFCSQALTWMLF